MLNGIAAVDRCYILTNDGLRTTCVDLHFLVFAIAALVCKCKRLNDVAIVSKKTLKIDVKPI